MAQETQSFTCCRISIFFVLLSSFTILTKADTSTGVGHLSTGRQLFQETVLGNLTGSNVTEGANATSPVAGPSLQPAAAPNSSLGAGPSALLVPAPGPGTILVPEFQSSCGVGGPCLNGGEPNLVERNGNVSCVCNCALAIGFDGTHCEIPRKVCSADGFYCANGGDCVAPSTLGGAFTCSCPPGYTGLQCKEKGVVCGDSLICRNGGTCNSTIAGVLECRCPGGYTGADCGSEVSTAGGGPASLFQREGDKVNYVGVTFGTVAGLLVVGLLAVGAVFCWRRVKKRRSPYSFDYLYNQQSAPMTGGAFSEVQMEDNPSDREYRNGSNIHNTSLNY